MDPLVISGYLPREVGFLVAAKSMRKPIIGHFARALKGIPVERA